MHVAFEHLKNVGNLPSLDHGTLGFLNPADSGIIRQG